MFLQLVRCLFFKGRTRFVAHDENLTLSWLILQRQLGVVTPFSFTDQNATTLLSPVQYETPTSHFWYVQHCTETFRSDTWGAGRFVLVHFLFRKEDNWTHALVPLAQRSKSWESVREETYRIASASPTGRARLHPSWGLFPSLEFRIVLWCSQMCWCGYFP